MQKVIFIVVMSSITDQSKGQHLISTPELDELISEGWVITSTENVTPPENKRTIIQVNLSKR